MEESSRTRLPGFHTSFQTSEVWNLMAHKRDFSRDELRLINGRASQLMKAHWEHCRNLMLDSALMFRRRHGELTEEHLQQVKAAIDIRIYVAEAEKPF